MDFKYTDPEFPSGLDETFDQKKFLKDNLDLLYSLIAHFSASTPEYNRITKALEQNRKALGLPF